ncbi:MAG: metallophosphoesterase family protein [Gemmatimonadota bacterium]
MTPFVYVTDLHGSRWKYERSLGLADEAGAKLLVNGGDMLPHGRMHEDQALFIRDFLDPYFAECQARGIRFLLIPGNDDLAAHDPLLDAACARYPLVANIARKGVSLGPYDFIGLDLVADFPFKLKDRARMDTRDAAFPPQSAGGILSVPGGWREIPDWPAYARTLPTIQDELASLPAPRDANRAVYLLHGPPAGLGLDVCRGGTAVGSQAVLRFVERVQPLLALHGHIHESPEVSGAWRGAVGRTVCVQPGQAYDTLTAVVGDLEAMTFERLVVPGERR